MSKKPITPNLDLPNGYTDTKLIKKEHLTRKIVRTGTGEIHIFQNAESKIDADIQIDREWKSEEEFSKQGKQTILAYHEEFFKVAPPKKQDITITSLMCWMFMLKNGKAHIQGVDSETGEKERKSSISSSKYTPGDKFGQPHEIKTYQAIKCLELFTNALGTNKSITEGELRAHVEKNAEILKTKQGPWRIFQYYRPQLIKAQLIRRN